MTAKAWKDVAYGAAALLAFPLVMNLSALGSSGEGRTVEDPLWHRGGEPPARSAGR